MEKPEVIADPVDKLASGVAVAASIGLAKTNSARRIIN